MTRRGGDGGRGSSPGGPDRSESAGAAEEFHPVSPERWGDLERLFGPRGACAGCWCTYWRQTAREYDAGKGEANRALLRGLVHSRAPLGVIGYRGGDPVAWCAVAPRADLVRLQRSRNLAPVDDTQVWSIVCLFIAREHRRNGLSSRMIDAACEYARGAGARVVEAYPVEPRSASMPDVFAWTGFRSAFDRVGFQEVARRAPTRPILRRLLAVG